MELQFNKTGRISGAAVRTYLLERSRVVQLTDPERNYHIFYQVSKRRTGLSVMLGHRPDTGACQHSLCCSCVLHSPYTQQHKPQPHYACHARKGHCCLSSMHSTVAKSQCRMLWLQLCDGASSAEKERWRLKPPQEFHYLNQSTCYNLPRVSNADEYRVGFAIAV